MLRPCGRAEVRPGRAWGQRERMSTCLSLARASQSFVVSGRLWWPGSSPRELSTLPRWEFFPRQSLTHPHVSFVTWDLGEGEAASRGPVCSWDVGREHTGGGRVVVGELPCPAAQSASGRCRGTGESR